MLPNAKIEAERFLSIADQFRLGDLITESSHPVTRDLSHAAARSITEALKLLFMVDEDVLKTYQQWIKSGLPELMTNDIIDSIHSGGRIFFVGCGATGRLSIQLDAVWRAFWQKSNYKNADYLVERTRSVMAGGDYALIKSVEGFEDFQQFGAKQIADMDVSNADVVFAITEGGETSFVIGAAWEALHKGAKVYFIYNNPDEILRKHAKRSMEIIDEPRVMKVNLTTGPMAIMGSTRMQATSIQLCAMTTVLEMAISRLFGNTNVIPIAHQFIENLESIHKYLLSDNALHQLAGLISLEEQTHASRNKSNYFADALGIDVLTDTTERSPTFCVPAFRKYDDYNASESWAFLFTPYSGTEQAWTSILHRPLNCLSWSYEDIKLIVPEELADKQSQIMKQIGRDEILKFRIDMDGMRYRPWEKGDAGFFVLSEDDLPKLYLYQDMINEAHRHDVSIGVVFIGSYESMDMLIDRLGLASMPYKSLFIPLKDDSYLKGDTHVAIKMVLNALSTCTMVRLGRVTGNCMSAVVPSNLKLIDRSIRCIQMFTGIDYEAACYGLFEAIEYLKPRMNAGIAYPPVVQLTVTKIMNKCTFDEAELAIS